MTLSFIEAAFKLFTQWFFIKILKLNGVFFNFEIFDEIFTVLLANIYNFLVLSAFLKIYDILTSMGAFGLSNFVEKFKNR